MWSDDPGVRTKLILFIENSKSNYLLVFCNTLEPYFNINSKQEYIIDKKLEIKSPQQVADMGIAKYNAECRSIVMKYSGEWEVS